MWDQGIISEEVYRDAIAQPLVLAEEDVSRTTATNNSYFTDALFEEVVQDIMEKEGITEAAAQQMLYTGGFTIEATVNPKIQTQMEELMLNTDDAYFPPAGMRRRYPPCRRTISRSTTTTVPSRLPPPRTAR